MSLADRLRAPESELFHTAEAAQAAADDFSFQIRRPFPPYTVGRPADWTADPHGDRTWYLYYHSLYWLQALDEAIRRFPERAEALRDELRALVLSYLDFLDAGTPGAPHDVWDDHATSYRASHLSHAWLAHLQGRMTPDEAARLAAFAAQHRDRIRGFLDSDRWLYSNHTLFQIEAMIDLAHAFFEGAERAAIVDESLAHFRAWLARTISAEEGTTKEHAAFYHVFLMARIREFLDYLDGLGLGAGDISQTLERMTEVLWRMSVADGLLPAFGDTKYRMKIAGKYLAAVRKGTLSETGRYIVSGGRRGQPVRGLSAHPENGHYFIRTGPPQQELFTSFLDKPFIGPHGHADGLGFETFFRGQSVFTDSGGPYKYGHPLRYRYFQKPVGHNVVVLGDGQQSYHSRIDRAQTRGGVTVIKGAARVGAVLWRRGFLQFRNDFIAVVDLLAGPAGPAYARFQLGLGVTAEPAGPDLWRLAAGPAQVELRLLRGLLGAVHPDAVDPEPGRIEIGGELLSLHQTAWLTREDSKAETTGLLTFALAPQALHLAVAGFDGATEATAEDQPDGSCRVTLAHAGSGRRYRLVLAPRRQDGALADFTIDAREET